MALEAFDAVDIIHKKRDGKPISTAEIDWLIDAYTRGYVVAEQMSALTMAIFLNGMNRQEIVSLTKAMIKSGSRMDFSSLSKTTVDKHSTGGVGDKITLPLMPLVASFGVAVPQLSGRGLGHTGGTLDKLESIPGWRADLSNEEIFNILEEVGGVICAAGKELAPADKKLYALRDITGTVEAIPLIASSIMSKKIAEGTQALVLDVKFGSGAFLKDINKSRELAKTMVQLGEDAGVKTSALITDMNSPLGRAIGNANEVRESIEVLSGGGPKDVIELTLALAKEMLSLAGVEVSPDDVAAALKNGKAMDVWRRNLIAQGANPDVKLPEAKETHTITSDRSGYITKIEALPFGVAAWRLGAGRARPQDKIQHAAGIDLHVQVGDRIEAGQPLYSMHAEDAERFIRAQEAIGEALIIGDNESAKSDLVVEKITIDAI